MSTLKINKHADVPTALDLAKEEVGKEAKRIFSAGDDALKAGKLGNESLMARPKTAFLASRKITPDAVMASHAWATKVREENRVIIGGFQSELEKDVLKFLLRGTCPIIVVRANRCPKTMPEELRAAAAANRILVISSPAVKNRRVGESAAKVRNRYVLELADNVVIGSLDPGGNLAEIVAACSKPTRHLFS